MMHRVFPATLVLVFGLAAAAQAQTYKIQLKEYPDVGKKITQTGTETSKESVKVTVMGMVVKDESKTKVKNITYTEETVTKGDGRPKAFKKTFTKATVTADGKTEKLPYEDRTILFEKKGEGYTAKAEGEPALDAKVLAELQDSVNTSEQLSRVFTPGKEVAVGDTWKIDIERVAAAFAKSLPLDKEKSTAQGKLVKAYKKGNHQFGVLEYDLKLAVKKLGPLDLKTPAPFQMKLTVDTAIDGSSTAGTLTTTGNLKAVTEVTQNGQTVGLNLNVEVSGREQVTGEE